jgi:hypothetical protein
MKLKNKMKSLLLVAAVFAVSLSASARGKVAVVPYLKTNYTMISAVPAESVSYRVVIMNKMGETVYSSNVKIEGGTAFSKLFDFSKLEDGEYKVRMMSRKGGSFEETFSLRNGILTIKAAEKEDLSEIDVKTSKNEVVLLASNLNELLVKMEVVTKSAFLDSPLPSELNYYGKINVASLPKDGYVMSFVSGNKVINYEFRK